MKDSFIFQTSRERFLMLGAFLAAAVFFIAMSVWATTVGTNVDSTGTLGAATSTPWGDLAVDQQASQTRLHPIFVVGDNGTTTPFVFVSQKGVVSLGSSTPSGLFLNPSDTVIGRNGASSDLFVSGGLGVANATTSDGDFVVGGTTGGTGAILSYTANGRFIVGASTTAATNSAAPSRFVFDGGEAVFSSGGTGTTTLSIVNEAAANGTNACIEMSADGTLYRIFINGARNGVTVEAGSCTNN